MPDDRLKNTVLARADDDAALTEQARLVLLAALESPADLDEVLGGSGPSPTLTHRLETPAPPSDPVGAYLESITVQGFRGIGPKVTVPLKPGPGLIVIAGRNGSGKSTVAEALELALTGRNYRWEHKAAIWKQDWRNLHAGDPARIRIAITEEGAGPTTIGVDWPSGTDVTVADHKSWVQRAGGKQEETATLGWDAALEMYRPLLSYDELGHILEGTPSHFHDQLFRLLGLEQLSEAITRLEVKVKELKKPSADLKTARDSLRGILDAHPDPRAKVALAQVKKTKPDIAAVRPLITESATATTPPAWQQAERLTIPDAANTARLLTELRAAAEAERAAIGKSDALAAERARLLEQGLRFHEDHGDQQCPICGQGSLNDKWAVGAREALERDKSLVRALNDARTAVARARSAVVDLIRSVPRPPSVSDGDLTEVEPARQAHDRFVTFPIDDPLALAEHVAQTLPELRTTYTALQQQAAGLTRRRADQWGPVAIRLASWVTIAQSAADAEEQLALAAEALKWLQANAAQLRNERIAPLAEQARQIWAALRQESNVDLGSIRLEGQKTNRRVELRAAVDGTEAEAFGVMSQGELQALALAIFIPRATSPQSPFRFLVLDDPIQAMDPSKIDGFLQVLAELAKDRQVIVLTHDDRLPSAIRTSRTDARIVEVTRGVNSVVQVAESSDPAKRLLDDAYALAADEAVPDEITKRAVARLIREALEVTAKDVYSARILSAGGSRSEVESAWGGATTVFQRLALALGLDVDDNQAVEKWRGAKPARGVTMAVANKGVHQGVFDAIGTVSHARRAVDDLAAVAR